METRQIVAYSLLLLLAIVGVALVWVVQRRKAKDREMRSGKRKRQKKL